MLVFIPPLTAFGWWLLYWIGVWNTHRFTDAVYNLSPIGITWAVPAFLSATVTMILPMMLFYRWRLKDRYSEFERYLNLRHRYNHDAAGIPVLAFFVSIILAGVLLVLHYRVVLANDEIIQYPFFSLSSVSHKYSDITDIRTAPQRRAPNGNLRDNDDFETVFSDGRVWSTHPNPAAFTTLEKRQMMEFVSKKGGRPIRQVPVLESSW